MADSIKVTTIKKALADQEALDKALKKYKETNDLKTLSKIKNQIDKNSKARG